MSKCPVHFAFDAPDFLCITSPYFSTQARGGHEERAEMSFEERERRSAEILARQEARREARALVVAENARQREIRKAAEAAAKEEISRKMQEAKRASMLTPEQRRAQRVEAVKRERAKFIENARLRKEAKADARRKAREAIPSGWMVSTAAARLIGVAGSTVSKYIKLGIIEYFPFENKMYIDPERMRVVFAARQESNLQMFRDNIHKARMKKHTFGGTVTE